MEVFEAKVSQAGSKDETASGGFSVNFENVKWLYVFSCVALGLVILSPTFAMVVTFPEGEKFSEMYVLGPGRLTEDYPFNVVGGGVYRVYLGVGNHMGDLEYYRVYVKLRNQTEAPPDTFNGTASPLEPIFEYRVFLRDAETWEKELAFSFEGVSFEGNFCRVSRLGIDGYVLGVDKVAVWDEENNGFYLQLFFELWVYNATAAGPQFHNRFVGIWLNMTRNL